MDLNKLREITEKLNDSLLLKGHAYPVLDLFIKQQEEALNLPVVGRSVWIVQDKRSLITHGLFSTKQKATNYINGSENMAIKKLNIDY